MRNMKSTKIGLRIVGGLLVCLFVAGLFFGCAQWEMTGDRVANPDGYTLEAEYVNGTDRHTLTAKAGEVLHVWFRTEKGTVDLEILSPDGSVLYRGNGKDVTDFEVNAKESGTYTVTVRAKRAKGSVRVQVESKDEK